MLRRVRRSARRRSFGALAGVAGAMLAAVVALFVACGGSGGSAAVERVDRDTRAPQRTAVVSGSAETLQHPTVAADDVRSRIGFRTRRQLQEHFTKHGAEFGRITQQEYLRAAQTLRDAPVGGSVEEIRRADGTVSRFDRSTGAFIAFDADGTIRTFFKPNAGESYFRRQATRAH